MRTLTALLFCAIAAPALANPSVADYLAAGYTVAEKREQEEKVAGKAPYEHMARYIHRTNYRLTKPGAPAVTCEMVYDSQHDTMKSACQPLAVSN